MEGILRQAPRLPGRLQQRLGRDKWDGAPCGCSAGSRIHAHSTQASRGSVGMVSRSCAIWTFGLGLGAGLRGVGWMWQLELESTCPASCQCVVVV